jgi:hypothetical protein
LAPRYRTWAVVVVASPTVHKSVHPRTESSTTNLQYINYRKTNEKFKNKFFKTKNKSGKIILVEENI